MTDPVFDLAGDGSKLLMPLRFGAAMVDMTLTRFSVAERVPTNASVCYAEKGDGNLVMAIYKRGRWLDCRQRPLDFTPTHWFRLGGAS